MILYKANNQAPISDVNLIAFGDQERARPISKISAVIVVTSDSTAFDVDFHIPTIFDHLIKLGAPTERVLLYWSCTSGVAFLFDGAGFIGERRSAHDFPY
jgi:hypothetical protein